MSYVNRDVLCWDYVPCGLVQVWIPVWTRVTGVICELMYGLCMIYVYVVLKLSVRFHRALLETHQPVCLFISYFRSVFDLSITNHFLLFM